jgi:hypothetical protein
MATSFETTSVRRTQNKYVTLSFFARAGANYSAASGFLRAFITTGTGTDGRLITGSFTSPTTLVDSNNVLTTSWKRFTVTTSAPVGSTVTQMGITFQFTPVGTAGASDYYDVTGVQLEAASAPSDFEFEDFGTTLRKCQRYFCKTFSYITIPASSAGQNGSLIFPKASTTAAGGAYAQTWRFPVEMRAAPNPVTTYSPSTAGANFFDEAGAAVVAATGQVGSGGVFIYNSGAAVVGRNAVIHATASAEL